MQSKIWMNCLLNLKNDGEIPTLNKHLVTLMLVLFCREAVGRTY